MAENTKIEWADSTWNPWIGCTKVSPACDHCYAEAQMDTRMGRVEWGSGKPRARTSAAYWRQPLLWNERADNFRQCGACGWRGDIIIRAEPIPMPCPKCGAVDHLPARRRVFCASLADWLDNEAPIDWLADLLSLIAATPNLDWLLLSKRIGNWRARIAQAEDYIATRMLNGRGDNCGWTIASNWLAGEAPRNVWLGATVVNQVETDRDVPKLLSVPAKVRFLSIEPMLGQIDLRRAFFGHCPTHDFPGGFCLQRRHPGVQHLGWVICGGESGPHARPMHPDWPRSLRDQCAEAGVPFLFKQWGEWAPRGPESMGYPPVDSVPRIRLTNRGENGQDLGAKGGDQCWMQRAGKKATGRLLDGVEHNGVPA